MSGGIEQLVARGAQDVFLTGDPQVSFFRSNYKRYTNFSQVRHRQIIQGNPADGGMSTVRFERKGDLLSYTYLVRKETGSTISINNYIDKVELYIGGQLIDTQTEDFFKDIYPETLAKNRSDSLIPKNVNTFAAPRFFFCNNYTNALPLVALQYHDVEMRIYWASGAGIDGDDTFECWSNYIYLDTDEREHFASKPQNMLIRQVQSVEASNESTQELNFNHPVSFITVNDPSPVDSSASVTNTKLLLKINGSDVGIPHSCGEQDWCKYKLLSAIQSQCFRGTAIGCA